MTLVAMAACSSSVTMPDRTTPEIASDEVVTTDGQLRFLVGDNPAQGGMMFIAGTVVGEQGRVVVTSTRYGSVCATNVTAHADVATGKITLAVKYSARLAICTAELRAITYRAEISALPAGTYDVDVVNTNADGTTNTVLTQRVNVT